MSKIPWKEACAYAVEAQSRFSHLADRWVVAGSIRRECDQVGDCEHVVIPDYRLFGTETVNKLWDGLDRAEANGEIKQHVRGDRHRRISFAGQAVTHDIFLATPASWGYILLIRTGPADFSRQVMVKLSQRGLKGMGGQVVNQTSGRALDTPTEDTVFALADMDYVSPPERGGSIR